METYRKEDIRRGDISMLTLARWSALNRAEYVLWSFSRTMWATGTVPQ